MPTDAVAGATVTVVKVWLTVTLTALVTVSSSTEGNPETVLVTEDGADSPRFGGAIALAAGTPVPDGRVQASNGDVLTVSYADLDPGEARVLVEAGQFIPGDGDVVEGIASVDESAVTGESAPVIRESVGDRSAVTGGTRVLSDWVIVRITADPGESFLDRMISMVEGARRRKTPNEIALTILLAAMSIIFLVACATLLPFSLHAVEVAGLTGALESPGPFTVFAPVDDAFAALPPGTVQTLVDNVPQLAASSSSKCSPVPTNASS
jgi:hypothetical protein